VTHYGAHYTHFSQACRPVSRSFAPSLTASRRMMGIHLVYCHGSTGAGRVYRAPKRRWLNAAVKSEIASTLLQQAKSGFRQSTYRAERWTSIENRTRGDQCEWYSSASSIYIGHLFSTEQGPLDRVAPYHPLLPKESLDTYDLKACKRVTDVRVVIEDRRHGNSGVDG
jgi:hypothetical protein